MILHADQNRLASRPTGFADENFRSKSQKCQTKRRVLVRSLLSVANMRSRMNEGKFYVLRSR